MSHRLKGRLIGASLGPGDPGLISRRAWEVLQGPAHWTYPIRRQNDSSYALDIVRRSGLNLPAAHTPLTFPMTHDTEILARYWLRAAQTVLPVLLSGRDVVFLVEGDASTYSTFTYLARSVRALDSEIDVETIAGVPSYHASAAHLGEPLIEGDETLAILPAGYGVDTVERLLPEFDALVLLKVKPLLDALIDLLTRRKLLAHSCFLEKVGTSDERVVRDISRLRGEKVNYLSLLLVKNPGRARGVLQYGCRQKARAEGKPA
ncbi:MAG: precorrin-2 C(20)-methyltransferase [Gammaproteobacteria bacterium]|nr:precorrin-2 C(20)-methyltransferase [Gammaproteobacteria bacterium]